MEKNVAFFWLTWKKFRKFFLLHKKILQVYFSILSQTLSAQATMRNKSARRRGKMKPATFANHGKSGERPALYSILEQGNLGAAGGRPCKVSAALSRLSPIVPGKARS